MKTKVKIFNQEIELNKVNLIIGEGNLINAYYEIDIKQIDEEQNAYVLSYLFPEYELNPKQQREKINNIIKNLNENTLITNIVIFTHSPYIINWSSCLVKAGNLYDKYENTKYTNLISEIAERNISIRNKGLTVFELTEENKLIKYDDFNGLPPDEDYLNNELELTNDMFSDLLEIQQIVEIQEKLKQIDN